MKDKPFILIIDHDSSELSALVSILKHGSLSLQTAMTAKRALEILSSRTPALVITEPSMPDMPDFEIIKHLHSDKRLSATRIVLITSSGIYGATKVADKVLIRPVLQPELLQSVRKLLGRRWVIDLPEDS